MSDEFDVRTQDQTMPTSSAPPSLDSQDSPPPPPPKDDGQPPTKSRRSGWLRNNLILIIACLLLVAIVAAALVVAFLPTANYQVSNEKTGALKTSWETDRTQESSMNDLNQKGTTSAPQQQVTNGWYANDLLVLQSKQIDEILKGLNQNAYLADAVAQLSKQNHDNNLKTSILIVILLTGIAVETIAVIAVLGRKEKQAA